MPKLPKYEDWTPPWGEDEDDFDAEKAKKLIYGLTSDKEKAAEKLSSANTAKKEIEDKLTEVQGQLDQAEAKGNEKVVGELQQKVAKLEGSLKVAERKLLVQKIADEKGIPLKQANRLQGETEEEIEADADEFLEAFGSKGKERNDDEDDDEDESPARRTPRTARTPGSDSQHDRRGDSDVVDLDKVSRI